MIVSKCPSCSDPVTVPDISREARVRCPLCQEEYTIADVLDGCPPMLEVLDASSDAESGYGAPAYDLEPATSSESAGGAFSFEESSSPALAATGTATATAPSRPTARRPRRKPRNPVIEIAKVVVGGLVGLFIAQMILWWLPFNLDVNQRDPASIGRSIGAYVPWLVPAQVRGETSEESNAGADSDDSSVFAEKNFDQNSNDANQSNNRPPRNQGGQANQGRSGQNGGNRGNRGGNRGNGEGRSDRGNGEGAGNGGQEVPDPFTSKLDDPLNKDPLNDLPDIDVDGPKTVPSGTLPTFGFQLAGRASPDGLGTAIRAANAANEAYDSERNLPRAIALYESLAKIGSALRSVEALDPIETQPHAAQLRELLASLDENKVAGIGKLAGEWLKDAGRSNDGIVLAGVVSAIEPLEGEYYQVSIDLSGTGQTVPVDGWGTPRSGVKVGAKVMVAGVIVEDPTEMLINYPGRGEQAICGLYVQVLKPAEEKEE